MNAAVALLLAASLATDISTVQKRYESVEAKRLVPMLSEVLRFPTFAFQTEAHAEQKAWLLKTATDLGFVARDAGKITEIELPGPADAPVLGLIVHGDVVPVDADAWSFPPFGGTFDERFVYGRGSVDDKGPLVQALLAMKALEQSGVARTHTIRLLIGSEEESEAVEIKEYLDTHAAPDYTLVLDAQFPVVAGEKAWNALAVEAVLTDDGSKPYTVSELLAGLAPSIVPDRAEVRLKWKDPSPARWQDLEPKLRKVKLPEGTRLAMLATGAEFRIVTYGKSAHAGMNAESGRNALVALARVLDGVLPPGGANDLLAFVRAGAKSDFGITDRDPLWGRYTINIARIKVKSDEEEFKRVLTTNIRSFPPRTGAQLHEHLQQFLADFNKRTGASLIEYTNKSDSYFEDVPLAHDPNAPLVQRLLAAYVRATGDKNAKPAVIGGGTYAKRLPNAIAFGMWFPGKAYPGHDVDEKIAIDELHRGTRVLIDALVDIATGPRIDKPF